MRWLIHASFALGVVGCGLDAIGGSGPVAEPGTAGAPGTAGGSDTPGAPPPSGSATGAPTSTSSSSGAPPAVALAQSKLVFVLAILKDADEISEFMDDQHCTTAIREVRPATSAVAWVSRGGTTPLARIGAAEGPWVSPSGAVVFANRAALSAGPALGITWSQKGTAVATSGVLWTGVHADGTVGQNCSNWSSQSGSGVKGRIGATGAAWTEDTTSSCGGQGRVLCFER